MEEETGFDLKRVNEFIEYKNKLYQRKKRFDEGKIELMQIIDDMEELYSFVKRNVHLFYFNQDFFNIYKKYVIRSIHFCEHRLRDIFIVNFTFHFDEKNGMYYQSGMLCEDVIKYIVYTERQRILKEHNASSLKQIDFTSKCLDSSYYIKKHCDELGIKCERIRINPGFYENDNIRVNGFHYFCILYIKDKQYLVDCTYPQFFHLDANLPNRLGIPLLSGCYVGYYMIVDEERKNFALNLIENGYVEFTYSNIKHYFDAFTISYRNGLYYENLGKVCYTTSYTAEDYLRFIYTEDSQYNYEHGDYLGYQRYPLMDYKIDFDKVYNKKLPI